MPKHQTENPQMQELYDVVRGLPGVRAIDGRSSDIGYEANVDNLTLIVKRLTKVYGKPTKDHPLLNEIEWEVRKGYRVMIDKADTMSGCGMIHSMHAYSF